MWIQARDSTREFKRPYMDAPLELSENSTAQVPDDLGERLLADPGVEVTEYTGDSNE